ncbi:substrate-binding periplasmic protein, partial [Maridesulfovibrio sp.]
ARTKEREDQFHWIGPIACYKWVFYGLKGVRDKVKTFEDAKNVSGIGVYRNDARAQFLKSKGFTNLEVMDSQEANFKKLLRGRVELVATSNIGVSGFLSNDLELRKRAVPILTFHNVKLYLTISKSTDQEKVLRWQKAFNTLVDRGTIRKIQEKWIEKCPD